jgi:hypothetical protein
VQTVRYVEEERVRRVQVPVYETVEQEVVRRVPVTTYRPVTTYTPVTTYAPVTVYRPAVNWFVPAPRIVVPVTPTVIVWP